MDKLEKIQDTMKEIRKSFLPDNDLSKLYILLVIIFILKKYIELVAPTRFSAKP
jgi:hypothetical protein